MRVDLNAVGLCSSLGTYPTACLAYRAGLSNFRMYDGIVQGEKGDSEPSPILVAMMPDYLDGFQRRGRLSKMLQIALENLLAKFKLDVPNVGLKIYLHLPDPFQRNLLIDDDDIFETYEEGVKAFIDVFLEQFRPHMPTSLQTAPVQTFIGERSICVDVLNCIEQDLEQGSVSYCVLLSVDSLFNDDVLEELLAENILKTSSNSQGIIPGEGAVALLFSRMGTFPNAICQGMNIIFNCYRSAFQSEEEEETFRSNQSDKMFSVIVSLLHNSLDSHIEWCSDMNEESYRVQEIGVVSIKLKQCFPETDFSEPVLLSEGFGEVAGISCFMILAMIASGLEWNYAERKCFLITLSESCTHRTVVLVQC